MSRINAFGQPIGEPVAGWSERAWPPGVDLVGRFCRVERLDTAKHDAGLWDAVRRDQGGRNFTYLFSEPFADEAAYFGWLTQVAGGRDPLFYAFVDAASGQAVGVGSYLRIDPAHGCLEVGHLNFSPLMQRRPMATEAMYLMMRHAFEALGYRRYEWKCDALNAPSRAAALRLGFSFEGIFRQAIVYKGRSRDTAWFSIIDREWPEKRKRLEAWLAPENFDAAGQQLSRLS